MKAAAKRFYDKVAVRAISKAEFAITLDGKDILTPAKKVLTLPSEPLALGIAVEWEKQAEKMRPDTMPLMKLATTTIDQVPTIRPTMVDSMLRCVECDLACFRSDEPALRAKEEAAFGPLLRWFADDAAVCALNVSDSLALSQPDGAREAVEAVLAQADDWELAALDQMTGVSKSFVISLAVARGFIGAEQGATAARVGETHQIEEWGEVEAGHDLDRAELAVRLSSASVFLRMLGR